MWKVHNFTVLLYLQHIQEPATAGGCVGKRQQTGFVIYLITPRPLIYSSFLICLGSATSGTTTLDNYTVQLSELLVRSRTAVDVCTKIALLSTVLHRPLLKTSSYLLLPAEGEIQQIRYVKLIRLLSLWPTDSNIPVICMGSCHIKPCQARSQTAKFRGRERT